MSKKPCIVYIATYPPKKCGIATFTEDLSTMTRRLFGDAFSFKIVAVMEKEELNLNYDKNVIYKIVKDQESDYHDCALKLNLMNEVVLVNIQHEFGIFGGDYGSYLIPFLEKIQKPVVTTFHTVVPDPNEKLFSLTKSICTHASDIITMTQNSKKLLINNYGIQSKKVTVIPHGIHSFHYESSDKCKKRLKISDRFVLLTFGFLSRNKGIEYVIEALPEVVKKYPNILYLVVGQTHPIIKKREGEEYRDFLHTKIKELKLQKNVKFVNSYQSLKDLITYLEASDIYIVTSLDPNQAVSGTFCYALGSGRSVISTNFFQAKESLKKDMGILVSPKKPTQYTKAILKILRNEKARIKMGKKAYFRTRKMIWQNVSLAYMRTFSKNIQLPKKIGSFPPISITHLQRLTDNFGIIQFAKLSVPDRSSGYTVDDNARALIVIGLYYKKYKKPGALKYLDTYLNFLDFTLASNGHFRNYVNFDRTFNSKRNKKEDPEDPTTRALYALARIASIEEIPLKFRKKAYEIFYKSFNSNIILNHPRSMAFFIKALYFIHKTNNDPNIKLALNHYSEILYHKWKENSTPSWSWFENFLAYSNGTISEAMLLAYKTTRNKKYLEAGRKSTEFLIKTTFQKGMYLPIGQNGWYIRGKKRIYFDQQPEEASSMVELLANTKKILKNKKYYNLALKAFNWFLGSNILNQVVYDCTTGGCYDGIGEREINLNQGAESTISYLIARLTISEEG